MPFDRQAAKASGYTDAEIDAYLADQPVGGGPAAGKPLQVTVGGKSFDRQAAKAFGYTDAEIDGYLAGRVGMNAPAVSAVDVPASAFAGSAQPPQAPLEDTGINRLKAGSRAAVDALSMNFADEAYAALQAGAISGPEYERILEEERVIRQQEEAAFPGSRTIGTVVGALGSMALPGGALMQTANRARQFGIATGLGAGMTALSGAGAARPGERTENLAADAVLGGVAGAAAVPVAALARRAVQALPAPARFGGNDINQTAADDVLRAAELDPVALRQAAADYYNATGRGARIADLLSPEQGGRFTNALGRSPAVRERISGGLRQNLRDLPEQMATRAEGPGRPATSEIAEQAELKRIDRLNYGAVENEVVPLTGATYTKLTEEILPFVSLPKATEKDVMERLANNELTGLDFQNIRESLSRFTGNIEKSGRAYEDLVKDLDAIVEATPIGATWRAAREASAAQRSRMEGVLAGQRAAKPSDEPLEVIGAIDFARALQQPGIAPGARGALFNQVYNDPSKAYNLARQLDENPGYQAQLRTALPSAEADEFISFAIQQRRAIDGLAALARIAPDKIEDALTNTNSMLEWGSFLSGGAGAGFKANLAENMARYVGVGEGAAERLADDLLNPARQDRVLQLLENAGKGRFGAREVLQSAIVSTANQFFTSDRPTMGETPPREEP